MPLKRMAGVQRYPLTSNLVWKCAKTNFFICRFAVFISCLWCRMNVKMRIFRSYKKYNLTVLRYKAPFLQSRWMISFNCKSAFVNQMQYLIARMQCKYIKGNHENSLCLIYIISQIYILIFPFFRCLIADEVCCFGLFCFYLGIC